MKWKTTGRRRYRSPREREQLYGIYFSSTLALCAFCTGQFKLGLTILAMFWGPLLLILACGALISLFGRR